MENYVDSLAAGAREWFAKSPTALEINNIALSCPRAFWYNSTPCFDFSGSASEPPFASFAHVKIYFSRIWLCASNFPY